MRLRLSDRKFIASCLLAVLAGCSGTHEVEENAPQKSGSSTETAADEAPEEKDAATSTQEVASDSSSYAPDSSSNKDVTSLKPTDNSPSSAEGAAPEIVVVTPALKLQESTPTRELISATSKLIDQSVASLPGNPDAMEMKARFEADYGDPTQATAIREQILKTEPNYIYAMLGIAEHAQKTGQLKRAAELYSKISQLAPNDPGYPIQQAICLAEASEIDNALSVLSDACKKHNNSATCHEELGKLLLQNQDPKASISAFEKSIAIDNSRASSHGGLATAYMRLGRRDEAKSHMRIQQQLRKNERDLLAKQRSEYDDSQAVRTDIATHLTSMARVLQASARSPDANHLLQQAVAIDKTHLGSRQLLLEQAKQAGKANEALRLQRELCQIQPDVPTPHIQYALLLASTGQLDEAVKHLNSFANSHPSDSSVRIVLAQFYVDVRPDLTKAIDFARQGAELSGKADDFAFLGSIYLRAGKVADARSALERAVEISPEKQQFRSMLKQLSNEE